MGQTVAQKLDAAARENPDKIVIVGPAGKMSWRELDGRAGAVAQTLSDQGTNLGDRLAIATDNITDTAIGIVGGLKIGAAITPLNPRLSGGDKRAVLDVLKTARVIEHLPPGEACPCITEQFKSKH